MLEIRVMTACLQHGQMPGEIGAFIGEGSFQAVADARLRREMDHAPHPIVPHQRSHALRVRNVHALHPETTTSVQGRRARILQRWIIVIIEIIYPDDVRSEEHTSELQSLMRISYAVFCLKKKITNKQKKL